MATIITFFLLFILPFIMAPFGITEFENPKVIIAEASIILLFFISLFSNKIIHRYSRSQILLYTSIFILTLIDLFFFNTQLSFFGNLFRMQGIFLLWLLILFSLFSTNIPLKQIPWFFYGLLLLLELVLSYFLPINESNRFVGTLGEPNALGAFVLFLWPFSFFAIKKYDMKGKVAITVILLFVSVILACTNSRSAIIAFIIQLIFLILRKYRIKLGKIILICFLLYLLSYTLPFFEHSTYENRVEIWQSALSASISRPSLGYGFGNNEFTLHSAAVRLNLPVKNSYVDSSHNIFLDWLVEGGVIGLSILCSLIFLSFKKFLKEENIRELTLLFGLITVLSFNPASIVSMLAFWWVIGQGLKSNRDP